MNRKRALWAVCTCMGLMCFAAADVQEPYPSVPVKAYDIRGGMGHAIERLHNGGKFTVAYFGGSITEAGEAVKGWRTRMTAYLRAQYPKAEITEVMAAIGGTTSELAAFRMDRDVYSKKPDLVFLEFSANDIEISNARAVRAVEAIVRRGWEKNPFLDFVFAYPISVKMTNDYARGQCHRPLVAHEAVAARYRIPSVNMGYGVMQLLQAGKLSMKAFTNDGVHPRAEGHALYFDALTNFWSLAGATAKCDHVSCLGVPKWADHTMQRAKMVSIDPAWCEGAWRCVDKQDPMFGRFLSRTDTLFETELSGSTVHFRYVGEDVALYVLFGPNAGALRIFVDDAPPQRVELFDCYCSYWRLNIVPIKAPPGVHDVLVELDSANPDRGVLYERIKKRQGEKAAREELRNPKYGGRRFVIGKILVNGDVLPMPCASAVPVKTIQNKTLRLDFHPDTAAFDVTDKRTLRTWKMLADADSKCFSAVYDVKVEDDEISFKAHAPALSRPVEVEIELDEASVKVEVEGEKGDVFLARGKSLLEYPYPFELTADERTLLPHGCGYAFPARMQWFGANFPEKMRFYSRDLRMAMWAAYGQRLDQTGELLPAPGFLAVVETPANAMGLYRFRSNGQRLFTVGWLPDRATWGHDRKVRYEFLTQADPMLLAKRYREILRKRGYYKTFAQKAEALQKKNPSQDMKRLFARLGGAPSVWYWAIDGDKARVCRTLREECGFQDFLFQFARRPDLGVDVTPEEVVACAKAVPGVLLSEYDIYQNTMESKYLPQIDSVRPYWIPAIADNDDIVYRRDGSAVRGWRVDMKDKSKPGIGCAIPCDSRVIPYAVKRLAAEFERTPQYNARYLDVIGCSAPGECWHPKHPMSCRDSIHYRRELMAVLGNRFGVLSATEDGEEYLADVCDYQTCGFSAPNHYRVDGGRWMWKIYEEDAPESIVFGTDETLRVPFWEMVFHGCSVSYWDWCDYNQKFPKIWWRRDLLNAVAATPPLYFFTPETFARFKGELKASYGRACATARATVFAEMTAYRFLTPDRHVQRSEFSNGVSCTANFGETPYKMADGYSLAPHTMRLMP